MLGERLKNQQFAAGDVGIAVAHICYAATELGMSTCILGWLNEKKIIENEKAVHPFHSSFT